MELLCTGDPKTSLNVAPERYSNVARFFNGINNSVAGSKRKQQNIRTMRCQVDGQATVLLYTSKAVRKGEQLRFDYNEGLKNLYPTDHFLWINQINELIANWFTHIRLTPSPSSSACGAGPSVAQWAVSPKPDSAFSVACWAVPTESTPRWGWHQTWRCSSVLGWSAPTCKTSYLQRPSWSHSP